MRLLLLDVSVYSKGEVHKEGRKHCVNVVPVFSSARLSHSSCPRCHLHVAIPAGTKSYLQASFTLRIMVFRRKILCTILTACTERVV
ncbi:hypothetical protein BBBOND_0101570 [Babesia bigemina]|uniref:Uncharacterized protein n=1 Tax=Babesia bigemina TaxID=5866 RepID=A0A061CZL0_BABBI|nr:hypothetical protein BBBOND_0101570 [Babesia bigemina]CDR93828.1 hypothetical protein BBBOND_0101570 [Babesia bigemina]|eukprot:XP_012766014.1 hypothetical protein BBBOND_0101570 [Babesia bigemina]